MSCTVCFELSREYFFGLIEIQSENEEDSVMFDTPSKRLGRRNIRKIQREETLSQLTRQARREELLRRQRLEENREIEEKEV